MDLIIEPLKKYSNFIQLCPYNVGNISAHNVPTECIKYPPFLPAADYRINVRLFNEKNGTIILFRYFGTVEAKGIHQLLVG